MSFTAFAADAPPTPTKVTGFEIADIKQAGSIEQISSAITQMETVTQQNAALVEQAAAAAESMRDRALVLQTLVERFKLGASQSTLTSTLSEHEHNLPAPEPSFALRAVRDQRVVLPG